VQFIASSGRVSSGGAACVDLLERSTTPLRRLAFVARLPVMRTLVDALYRAVAANRTAISKALGLVACRVPDP
jgi:predicted DCC family thiol-disulfide oxidoreductase YuxK